MSETTNPTHARGELFRHVNSANTYNDPKVLARLVDNAPAFQTLTAQQWWNIALRLAQYVQHPERFPEA